MNSIYNICKKEKEGSRIFVDSKLLAEDWLSKEDEEAWKDL
ncbi:MAG: hypothetical protein AABX66_03865 [Nanoarchaeota archaeon]